MQVTLKHSTPLHICSEAIRKCWASEDKSDTTQYCEEWVKDSAWVIMKDMSEEDFKAKYPSNDMMPEAGPKDRELIDRVGNKNKHASTLEHLVYNFDIDGISRACLQELARHRIASLSVKSTRYTLKELKNESEFFDPEKYLVFTGNTEVDEASCGALQNLKTLLESGISNDIAKYCLPESYKTSLAWTVNARALQNFLALRSSKAALWEIRDLAQAIFDQLPEEHKYLFEDSMSSKD